MIFNPARPRPGTINTRVMAILIGLMLPISLPAQDNNPGECTANKNSADDICSEKKDKASAQDAGLDWQPLDAIPAGLQTRRCINLSLIHI